MRNLKLFLLLLAGSCCFQATACWFYPYGEEIRYSFLNPDHFVREQWRIFNYSSQAFESDQPASWTGYDANIELWAAYCKGKVPQHDIQQAVYQLGYFKVDRDTSNLMLQYFRTHNDRDALEYLRFAKMCETLNQFENDLWERNRSSDSVARSDFIQKAIKQSERLTQNRQLARRYAFLAIRLAHYNHDAKTVRNLYQQHFSSSSKRDILNHWSLYFFMLIEKNSAHASYYAAQVFMNAPDKRYAVLGSFNRKIPVEQILALATTSQEKSNVYALRAIMRHDRALSDLIAIYRLAPDHEALETLILREVNKLEDWIYTPYYTYWTPSVIANTGWWSKIVDKQPGDIYRLLQQRIRRDREYAASMFEFLNAMDERRFSNTKLLEVAKVQLLFMSQRYRECIRLVDRLSVEMKPDDPLHNQILKIKVLCSVADQPADKAGLPAEAEALMKAEFSDLRFVFAVARELEYLGNLPLAIAIMAQIDDHQNNIWLPDEQEVAVPNEVFWRGPIKGNSVVGYDDFFDHYFHYLDHLYGTDQLEQIVASIGINHHNPFMQWLYGGLERDRCRLLDLLGTKYIRKDSLDAALYTFGLITDAYWATYYTPWERSYYCYLFDEDPFYQLKYTHNFIDHNDFEVLNKEVVTRKLIHFKQRASDPKEPDRDYYWFLVANCYYNMSYYGNSWMMRRFYRSSDDSHTGHEDDAEYYQCNRAREYYGQAMKHARTDEFRALCLTMMARCERFRLGYEYPYGYPNWKWHERPGKLHQMNKYYRELEQRYPNYAEELISGCEIFRELFEKRRAK